MKTWVYAGLLVAACGTSQATEEAPVRSGSEAESVEGARDETPTPEAPDEAGEETSEALSPIEGPSNFVTPHHCHPPGPCTFQFESLRGVQHIDVGHGHASAPRLGVVLRVGEGQAHVERLDASAEHDGAGEVVGRARQSLEGGAFYVTLGGEGSAVEVELEFRP